MNIKELTRIALDEINAMTADDFEKELIEFGYGYKPVRKSNHELPTS